MFITSDREVYEDGDEVVLMCVYQGGPQNTLQWLKDGELLENATEDTITLPWISEQGSGEVYTCLVTNPAGRGHANISLNIAHDIFAEINEGIELFCSVSGYPEAVYQWTKVNGSLPVTSEIIESGSLIINNVHFGDEGEYFCETTSNNITTVSNILLLTGKQILFLIQGLRTGVV